MHPADRILMTFMLCVILGFICFLCYIPYLFERKIHLRALRKARFDNFARCGIDDSNEHYPFQFKFIPSIYETKLISITPEFNETLHFSLETNLVVSKLTGIKYEFVDFNQLKYTMKEDKDPRIVELSSNFCPHECKPVI
jgi:hypothetical protein